jgi:hypothetical protein
VPFFFLLNRNLAWISCSRTRKTKHFILTDARFPTKKSFGNVLILGAPTDTGGFLNAILFHCGPVAFLRGSRPSPMLFQKRPVPIYLFSPELYLWNNPFVHLLDFAGVDHFKAEG